MVPSGLQAQAVTLVLAPRSLDLTTITDFCFRRLATSHIRSVESLEHVRKRFESVGWNAPRLISAVWPLKCQDATCVVWTTGSSSPGVLHISEVDVAFDKLQSTWSVIVLDDSCRGSLLSVAFFGVYLGIQSTRNHEQGLSIWRVI